MRYKAWIRVPLPTPKYPDGYTLISKSDWGLFLAKKWCLMASGHRKPYVTASELTDSGYRVFKLHRYLLGITDPRIHIDHINGNRLDNRRENLRLCGLIQNNINRPAWSKNPLFNGYKGLGVHRAGIRRRKNNVLSAGINISYIKYHILGAAAYSAEDCAWAYNQAAKKFFEEFAWLNKLPKGYRPSAQLRAKVKARLQVIEQDVKARRGKVIVLPDEKKEAA